MENKNILYIIVRNDLPSMNPGKAMAQASHASAKFVNDYHLNNLFHDENDWYRDADAKDWIYEGKGFGTTVVLEGDLQSIRRLNDALGAYEKVHLNDIVDETYPFKMQKEIIQLLIDDNSDFIKKHNISYDEEFYELSDGMVDCTRTEHTCSWIFVSGEKNIETFKEYCKRYNIHLHR